MTEQNLGRKAFNAEGWRRLKGITTLVLGLVSFACLAGYWIALTDIWHELGRPDFWQGEGVAAFEWRWLAIMFWPILAFHLVFLLGSFSGVVRRV